MCGSRLHGISVHAAPLKYMVKRLLVINSNYKLTTSHTITKVVKRHIVSQLVILDGTMAVSIQHAVLKIFDSICLIMICKYTCTHGRPQGKGKSRRPLPPPPPPKYISMWGPFSLYGRGGAFFSMWWHFFPNESLFYHVGAFFLLVGGLSLLTKNSKDANACTCMSLYNVFTTTKASDVKCMFQ